MDLRAPDKGEFVRHFFRCVALLLFVFPVSSFAVEPHSEDKPYDFIDVIVRGLNHHPEVTSEKGASQAEAEALERKGLFPDPRIAVGRENINVMSNSTAGTAQTVLSVSQEWPWPGSREREVAVARARLVVSDLQREQIRVRRALLAGRLFLQRLLLLQSIRLESENLRDLETVGESTLKRRKRAQGGHGDDFSVNTEMILARSRMVSFRTELLSRERYLAGVLALPVVPQFVNVWPTIREGADMFSALKWDERDFAHSILEQQLVVERSRVDSINDLSRPSLSTSANLMRNDMGMVMASVMLGVKVPLFSAGTASSAQRELNETSQAILAQSRWYEERRKLAADQVQERLNTVDSHLSILDSQLIPLASEHVRLALADFAAGRLSVASFLDARRKRIDFLLAKEKMIKERYETVLDAVLVRLGYADEILNAPFPAIAIAGMGSEMGSSQGTAGMSSMPSGSQSSVDSYLVQPSQPSTDDESGVENGGMGGMGM